MAREGSLNGRENGEGTSVQCLLCEKSIAPRSRGIGSTWDDNELSSCLGSFRTFLQDLNCLDEKEALPVSCSAANTCESCKSKLLMAKKHSEPLVEQHDKVKRSFLEFSDDLQTLLDKAKSVNTRLSGSDQSQGEFPRAITKALEQLKGVQNTIEETLGFLQGKFKESTGLFPSNTPQQNMDQVPLSSAQVGNNHAGPSRAVINARDEAIPVVKKVFSLNEETGGNMNDVPGKRGRRPVLPQHESKENAGKSRHTRTRTCSKSPAYPKTNRKSDDEGTNRRSVRKRKFTEKAISNLATTHTEPDQGASSIFTMDEHMEEMFRKKLLKLRKPAPE